MLALPLPPGPSHTPIRGGEVRLQSGRAKGTPGCVTWEADAGVHSKLSPQPPSSQQQPVPCPAPRNRTVAELPHLPGGIRVQGLVRGGRSEHSTTQLPATGQPNHTLSRVPVRPASSSRGPSQAPLAGSLWSLWLGQWAETTESHPSSRDSQ